MKCADCGWPIEGRRRIIKGKPYHPTGQIGLGGEPLTDCGPHGWTESGNFWGILVAVWLGALVAALSIGNFYILLAVLVAPVWAPAVLTQGWKRTATAFLALCAIALVMGAMKP